MYKHFQISLLLHFAALQLTMSQLTTLSPPGAEAQGDVKMSPKLWKSRDSVSFETEDHDAEKRNSDVRTSLLRKLSLVEYEDKASKVEFRRRVWFKVLISLTCITSIVSVSLNTPTMFRKYPHLLKITLGLDVAVGCILTAEAFLKCLEKGFFHSKKSYLRSLGRCFEFCMVIFIWISVAFQILEVAKVIGPFKTSWYTVVSGLRSPRPLLLFRVAKNILHVGIPKSVSKKPLRQLRNVLVFTMYFMTLAAIIGVQIFGPLAGYCVRNSTDPTAVKYRDLMIPASRCNVYSQDTGYKCPEKFVCMEIKMNDYHHMNTYFEQAAVGLQTVYEAQSQEGWTQVMYDAMDSTHYLAAVVYFILLIFFIAWLAKNIFIAIVTEVFADLRSHVDSLYGSPSKKLNKDTSKVLIHVKTEPGLKLIQGDEFLKTDIVRRTLRMIAKSRAFRWLFLVSIIIDALLQSTLTGDNRIYTQIAFTVLFDVEAIIKLVGYGPKTYLNSVPHRFEIFLAVFSSIFLASLGFKESMTEYALFQVMRPFRLILAWPSLASFLKRILGSGKKLGRLILFTLIFIVIAAGVSLQLFCNINIKEDPEDHVADSLFHTFPEAAQAMFQVLMQEAWNDVLHNMLSAGGRSQSALVFIFFILYHLIAAVILISVFVALILDNLELDEELKIIKQHQLGEEAEVKYKMPLRLRMFEKFKARPKIVKMENIGCSVPKVRESFMGNYMHSLDDSSQILHDIDMELDSDTLPSSPNDLGFHLVSMAQQQPTLSSNKDLRKQSSVTALIKTSHQRKFRYDSSGHISQLKHRGSIIRRRRSNRHQISNALSTQSSMSVRRKDAQHLNQVAAGNTLLSPKKLPFYASPDRGSEKNLEVVRQRLQEAQRRKEAQVNNLRENYPYFDKSLFFLPHDSKFREIVRKIVHARYVAFSDSTEKRFFSAFSLNRFKKYLGSQAYLDWFMMFLTHLSCWVMMLETPQQRTFQNPLTKYVEHIFVITTTIELGLKIMADGLFLTPTALVKDFAGVLHVFIYIVGLVYVIWHPQKIPPGSAAQILLVLRAFRPLRIITLAPQLRNVVKIFVRGYKDIFKVAILQLLLMFVFANYGVQMFSHKLGRCTNPDIKTEWNCTGLCYVKVAVPKKLEGLKGDRLRLLVPCVWRNPRNFNFDTLPNAFLALFEVLSLEGWTEVRDILTKQYSWYASIYIHVYVFLACLIGLTLFIGVVVSNFNENKGTALHTVDQRRWEDLKKRLKLAQPIHIPPRPENNEQRGKIYDFLQTNVYRWLYIVLVILNGTTLLVFEWYPASFYAYKRGQKNLHLVFTAIAVAFTCAYIVDFIIKLKAYRFSGYWLSWRNRFDLVITVLSIIWSVFQLISYKITYIQAVTLPIGVALIIFRLFTLAGKINSIRMLMLTVGMSLFKSFYTISVLVVLMMCYALVGVVMFGSVRFGVSLNRHANFQTSWKSMLLLFRITTGEDWNKLMHDCMVVPPQCSFKEGDNYWETDCGSKFVATLYFFSYYLLITYIFLNLFIAVVLENFSLFSSTDEDMLMTNSDLKAFQEVWNIVDKDRSGKLSAKHAKLALGLSIAKLEFNITADRFLYKRMCAEIDKISGGKEVSFHDLLLVLAYNDSRVKISRNLQLEERLSREDQVRAITEEVAAHTIRTWCLRMWREKTENKDSSGRLFAKQSGVLSYQRFSRF